MNVGCVMRSALPVFTVSKFMALKVDFKLFLILMKLSQPCRATPGKSNGYNTWREFFYLTGS